MSRCLLFQISILSLYYFTIQVLFTIHLSPAIFIPLPSISSQTPFLLYTPFNTTLLQIISSSSPSNSCCLRVRAQRKQVTNALVFRRQPALVSGANPRWQPARANLLSLYRHPSIGFQDMLALTGMSLASEEPSITFHVLLSYSSIKGMVNRAAITQTAHMEHYVIQDSRSATCT